MISLFFPIAVTLLVVFSLVAFGRRRWTLGIILAFASILLNIYSECFAIHFGLENSDQSLRLFAYNVNSLGDGFDDNATSIADLVAQENPDFLYLTEYYENTTDTLIRLLEDSYQYVDVSNRWAANEGDVLLSNWQIDSVKRLKQPYIAHSVYRVQISKSIDTVCIYCCHFTSNLLLSSPNKLEGLREGYRRRALEANMLYGAIKQERFPTLVIGDLNDLSGSYTVRRIEKAGMKDAWWKGGLGYGATYHDHGLRLRLDHILYDDSSFQLCEIKTVGGRLSDHKGLVASFQLLPKN